MIAWMTTPAIHAIYAEVLGFFQSCEYRVVRIRWLCSEA